MRTPDQKWITMVEISVVSVEASTLILGSPDTRNIQKI